MGAVLGTIIYRISMVSVIYGGSGFFIQRHAKIFTAMTAALINLVIIMILTRVRFFFSLRTKKHILRIAYCNMQGGLTPGMNNQRYSLKGPDEVSALLPKTRD